MANRKTVALLRTVTSHVTNMITGVQFGFMYKMRLVHNHFPINVAVEDNGKKVELRNYLGEKVVRRVTLNEGVIFARSTSGVKVRHVMSYPFMSRCDVIQCSRVPPHRFCPFTLPSQRLLVHALSFSLARLLLVRVHALSKCDGGAGNDESMLLTQLSKGFILCACAKGLCLQLVDLYR
jgi:hypothetical protein